MDTGMIGLVDEQELLRRFQPIFEKIAAGAGEREIERALPLSVVDELRDAGFTSLRVPQAQGGSGISVRTLTRLLIELGAADSNLPQILRAHFAFVEGQLERAEPHSRDQWLDRVAKGEVFAAAMAERTKGTETTATLMRDGDAWRLEGTKYYCTGSLYANALLVVARDGEDILTLSVPRDAPGVTVLDDWIGFGQRLTASGTSHFEGVRVEDWQIIRRHPRGEFASDTALIAFYQLFHLSALAGIAQAVLKDATAFVQAKTRTFGLPGVTSPRHDPLVQRVVGRLSSLALTAESLALTTADAIDRANDARQAGGDFVPLCHEAELVAYRAQMTSIDLVLQASTLLFEVGGASATDVPRAFDRHWRNARVLASHNPAIQRERAIGDYVLNGRLPSAIWKDAYATQREAEAKAQGTDA